MWRRVNVGEGGCWAPHLGRNERGGCSALGDGLVMVGLDLGGEGGVEMLGRWGRVVVGAVSGGGLGLVREGAGLLISEGERRNGTLLWEMGWRGWVPGSGW